MTSSHPVVAALPWPYLPRLPSYLAEKAYHGSPKYKVPVWQYTCTILLVLQYYQGTSYCKSVTYHGTMVPYHIWYHGTMVRTEYQVVPLGPMVHVYHWYKCTSVTIGTMAIPSWYSSTYHGTYVRTYTCTYTCTNITLSQKQRTGTRVRTRVRTMVLEYSLR